MPASKGYAASDAQSPLAPFGFTRREPGATEIVVDILYCGVCHSDLHMARNEWGQSIYPLVPGHEIVGPVTAVGKNGERSSRQASRGHRRDCRLVPSLSLRATKAKSISAMKAPR